MGNHLTDKIKWCRSLIFKKMSTCFLSYKLISGLLAHFRAHRSVPTVYFRLRKQGFSPGWITSSFSLGNTRKWRSWGCWYDQHSSSINKFHFPVQSKLPHSFHTYMKNEVFQIDFNFSFIHFLSFFLFFNFYPFILRVNWIGYMEWVLSIQYKDLNVC